MKYFKQSLLAAVLPVVFQASANAAMINLGTITPTDLQSFPVNINANVEDTYTFDTLVPFSFTSAVTAGGLGIDSLSSSLTGPSFSTVGTDSTGLGGAIFQSTIIENFLGAGSYSFTVDIDTSGSAPVGTYFANFTVANANVTAVPEPHTYAMFLAGLGLLGFAKRRKD